MPTRVEVYKALDTERNYQCFRIRQAGANPETVRPHSVEEFVVYMDEYTTELKNQLSRIWVRDRKCPSPALDTLRKITALGVAAMEQHGAPLRVW